MKVNELRRILGKAQEKKDIKLKEMEDIDSSLLKEISGGETWGRMSWNKRF